MEILKVIHRPNILQSVELDQQRLILRKQLVRNMLLCEDKDLLTKKKRLVMKKSLQCL